MGHKPGHGEDDRTTFPGEAKEQNGKPGRSVTNGSHIAPTGEYESRRIPNGQQNAQRRHTHQQLLLERAENRHALRDNDLTIEQGGGKDADIGVGGFIQKRRLTQNNQPAHRKIRPAACQHFGILRRTRRISALNPDFVA